MKHRPVYSKLLVPILQGNSQEETENGTTLPVYSRSTSVMNILSSDILCVFQYGVRGITARIHAVPTTVASKTRVSDLEDRTW